MCSTECVWLNDHWPHASMYERRLVKDWFGEYWWRSFQKWDLHTHTHTSSEHNASVNIVQTHCSMPCKKCPERPLRDTRLIIGRHCHNIQSLLLHAFWIGCLATHRITLLSRCSFSFIAFSPSNCDGKGAVTPDRKMYLTVMHLSHPESDGMAEMWRHFYI